jgi:hypothetical protein
MEIRNCSRYSYALTTEHSKNFSSTQATKAPRTVDSSSLTASLSWAQSLSLQWINIVPTDHLHPHIQYSINHHNSSKHQNLPKTNNFFSPTTLPQGCGCYPDRRAHMHTCLPHKCTCMCASSSHMHALNAHLFTAQLRTHPQLSATQSRTYVQL